jgi:hypothetical protein
MFSRLFCAFSLFTEIVLRDTIILIMWKGGKEMTVSKKQQACVNRYKRTNYDRLELLVPKGDKDEIKTHATSRGESVNAFINRAIAEQMQRDQERQTGPADAEPQTGPAAATPTE